MNQNARDLLKEYGMHNIINNFDILEINILDPKANCSGYVPWCVYVAGADGHGPGPGQYGQGVAACQGHGTGPPGQDAVTF